MIDGELPASCTPEVQEVQEVRLGSGGVGRGSCPFFRAGISRGSLARARQISAAVSLQRSPHWRCWRGSRGQRSEFAGSSPGGGLYRRAPHAPGDRRAPRRSEHRHSGRHDRRSDPSGRGAGRHRNRGGDGAGRPDVARLPERRRTAPRLVAIQRRLSLSSAITPRRIVRRSLSRSGYPSAGRRRGRGRSGDRRGATPAGWALSGQRLP